MSSLETQSLIALLTVIATGGATGIVTSFLVENVPGFDALPKFEKRWIFLGISILLALLGWLLLVAVGAAELTFTAGLHFILVGGFLAFGSGTMTHSMTHHRGLTDEE